LRIAKIPKDGTVVLRIHFPIGANEDANGIALVQHAVIAPVRDQKPIVDVFVTAGRYRGWRGIFISSKSSRRHKQRKPIIQTVAHHHKRCWISGGTTGGMPFVA